MGLETILDQKLGVPIAFVAYPGLIPNTHMVTHHYP